MPKIAVDIQGKSYQVPEGITAVQALWYTGHELIKGIDDRKKSEKFHHREAREKIRAAREENGRGFTSPPTDG